jgi:transcriptional regulator of acetoin/glycerol metabolism
LIEKVPEQCAEAAGIKLMEVVDSWVFLWKEDFMTKTISASVERQLERGAKHRLAVLRHVEEVSGSVAATCRCYGISRQAYYKSLKRYESEGLEGLKDRSSAPHPLTHRHQLRGH